MEDQMLWKTGAVVIPAYQPDENLPALAEQFEDSGNLVLVVDDGSGEAYRHIFDALDSSCVVLRHEHNRGKGAALKTAFSYIEDCLPNVGVITTADADGQHLAADAAHVALCAWTKPGTLALGSREFDGDIPLRSKLGNKITRLVFHTASGVRLRDTQTGLRAFDCSLLPKMLEIPGERYEYEMNVLLACSCEHIPMQEVPIRTVYHDKQNSCSHFDSVRDSFRIYKNLLKFSAASLVSFAADYGLFLGLHALLPAGAQTLLVSNVLARVCSAALNFELNSRAVFCDHNPVKQALPQYAALAAGILAANSVILSGLVHGLHLPAAASKLLTEVLLFSVSYFVQSYFIFRGQNAKGGVGFEAHSTEKRIPA